MGPGTNARRFFRQFAAILDLIPYWSRDTHNLNLAATAGQKCVRAWHQVIAAFIEDKRPRLIIVNNRSQPAVINGMLDCEIVPIGDGGFLGGTTAANVPVLAHPFLSNWRGVSQNSYIERFSDAVHLLGLSNPILNRTQTQTQT